MGTTKLRNSHRDKRLTASQKISRLMLIDILPTLFFLLAMAFGMAYVAEKAVDWPPGPDRTTASAEDSALTG